MMLLPLNLEAEILRWLGLLGGIAAALLVIPRTREVIIGPARRFISERREARERERHERGMLQHVHKLLAPNGGASITDAVQRLEEGFREINDHLQQLALDTRRQNDLTFASFDLANEPVLFHDQHGHVLFANRRFSEITGIRSDDATGTGWLRAVHPGDRLMAEDEIARALAECRASTIVMRIVHQVSGVTQRVRTISRPSGGSGHLRIFSVLQAEGAQ